MKGKKFSSEGKDLIHEIEKTEAERDTSIQTSIAVNEIRKFPLETGLCTEANKKAFVDGDWNIGWIFVVQNLKSPERIVEKNRRTNVWEVYDTAEATLEGFDFAELLTKLNERK